jgi:hypothetical protein
MGSEWSKGRKRGSTEKRQEHTAIVVHVPLPFSEHAALPLRIAAGVDGFGFKGDRRDRSWQGPASQATVSNSARETFAGNLTQGIVGSPYARRRAS